MRVSNQQKQHPEAVPLTEFDYAVQAACKANSPIIQSLALCMKSSILEQSGGKWEKQRSKTWVEEPNINWSFQKPVLHFATDWSSQNTGSAKAAYKNSMMYPNFTRELIGKNSPASFQGSIVIVNIGRLHPETSKFYFPICFGDIQCTHVESHSFLLFPFLGWKLNLIHVQEDKMKILSNSLSISIYVAVFDCAQSF